MVRLELVVASIMILPSYKKVLCDARRVGSGWPDPNAPGRRCERSLQSAMSISLPRSSREEAAHTWRRVASVFGTQVLFSCTKITRARRPPRCGGALMQSAAVRLSGGCLDGLVAARVHHERSPGGPSSWRRPSDWRVVGGPRHGLSLLEFAAQLLKFPDRAIIRVVTKQKSVRRLF